MAPFSIDGDDQETAVKDLETKVNKLTEQYAASQELLLSFQKQIAELSEVLLPKEDENAEPSKTTENATPDGEAKESIHLHSKSKLDLDGDGIIDEAEIAAAERKVKWLTRELWVSLVVIAVLLSGFFAVSYTAALLSKEFHTEGVALVDGNGTMVLTRTGSSFIYGVAGAPARRLAEAEGAEKLQESYKLGLEYTVIKDIMIKYSTEGESQFVVPFEDRSTRTLNMQGFYRPDSDNPDIDYYQAWGKCGSCEKGEVRWVLDCMRWTTNPSGQVSCVIEYWYKDDIVKEAKGKKPDKASSKSPSPSPPPSKDRSPSPSPPPSKDKSKSKTRRLTEELKRRRLAEDPLTGQIYHVDPEDEKPTSLDRVLSAKACAR